MSAAAIKLKMHFVMSMDMTHDLQSLCMQCCVVWCRSFHVSTAQACLRLDVWPLSERGCMRADFGFSISAMHSVAQTEVGTPNYCAPEVLMRATMDPCYDGKKADGAHCKWHWQSGVCVYAFSSVLVGPLHAG